MFHPRRERWSRALSDGFLQYFQSLAPSADANIEERIKREGFDFRECLSKDEPPSRRPQDEIARDAPSAHRGASPIDGVADRGGTWPDRASAKENIARSRT